MASSVNQSTQVATPASLKQTIGTRSLIREEELAQILRFIQENPHLTIDVEPSQDRVRRVGYKSDGSRWIHLNRNKSQSDLVVGKGGYKKAVHTINALTGELAIRTTERCSKDVVKQLRELEVIERLHKARVPGVIKIYHSGIIPTKKIPEKHPEMVAKFETIQEYCSGGTLGEYINNPKNAQIQVNPILFASKLLDTFIGALEIGVTILDLGTSNVLINKDGDPVIADWGTPIEFEPDDKSVAPWARNLTYANLRSVFRNLIDVHLEYSHLIRPLVDRMEGIGKKPTLQECKEYLNKIAREHSL